MGTISQAPALDHVQAQAQAQALTLDHVQSQVQSHVQVTTLALTQDPSWTRAQMYPHHALMYVISRCVTRFWWLAE